MSKSSPFGMPLPADQAECVAEAYVDSGLSAGYLDALGDGRTPRKVSKDDREALADLGSDVTEDCLSR